MLSAVAATLCAFLAAAAKIAAVFSKSIHGRLVAVNRPTSSARIAPLESGDLNAKSAAST